MQPRAERRRTQRLVATPMLTQYKLTNAMTLNHSRQMLSIFAHTWFMQVSRFLKSYIDDQAATGNKRKANVLDEEDEAGSESG